LQGFLVMRWKVSVSYGLPIDYDIKLADYEDLEHWGAVSEKATPEVMIK